jgi:hypothetical protein
MLQDGVEIAKLPQNFKDAVFTAQCLEIHYIWIDSLCILQDSKKDWAEQAPQMSQIYQNGLINIAMSAATNSDESCFQKRDLSQVMPCIVQTGWEEFQNGEVHVYDEHFWLKTIESTPLVKRAWAVQELLLPSRILHLTGQQLLWECFELNACETYPAGLPPTHAPNTTRSEVVWSTLKRAAIGLGGIEGVSAPLTPMELLRLWRGVVEDFTTKDLTIPSDRLMAIAGIAKMMSQALNDSYCAGLWQKDLDMELMWHLSDEVPLEPRPEVYRAPSWSWASVEGKCTFHQCYLSRRLLKIKLIEIIECTQETVANDPFGFVNAATMIVYGWPATIQLKLDEAEDCTRPTSWFCCSAYLNGSWFSWEQMIINLDCVLPHLQLQFLPIFESYSNTSSCYISGLLLIATGRQKGQFQRVGTMRMDAVRPLLENSDVFRNPKNEQWFEYESQREDGRYRISII